MWLNLFEILVTLHKKENDAVGIGVCFGIYLNCFEIIRILKRIDFKILCMHSH